MPTIEDTQDTMSGFKTHVQRYYVIIKQLMEDADRMGAALVALAPCLSQEQRLTIANAMTGFADHLDDLSEAIGLVAADMSEYSTQTTAVLTGLAARIKEQDKHGTAAQDLLVP